MVLTQEILKVFLSETELQSAINVKTIVTFARQCFLGSDWQHSRVVSVRAALVLRDVSLATLSPGNW